MTLVAVFVSDRGNLYLPGCLSSFEQATDLSLFKELHVVDDRDHELGMAGAVQAGFQWVLDVGADHVLWVEEDFRFHELPVLEMVQLLERHRHLAQIVLKRQPWSAEERAAGDMLAVDADAYTQRAGFVEHQRLFSLNPCVIPRRVLEFGWPAGGLGVGNESGFTKRCLDKFLSFAYYGNLTDPPRVEHVGAHRGAGWRL